MPVPYRNNSAGLPLPSLPPDLPPKMDYSAASPSPVDSGRGGSPANGMSGQYGQGQSIHGNGPGPDTGQQGDPTKRNPLVDLMDSEKTYVEQLGLVIRVSLNSCA